MRFAGRCLALCVGFSFVAACSGDDAGGGGGGGGDGGGGGGGGGAGTDAGTLEPPDQGFQIVTSEITLQPGEERTFCYYTTIPVSTDVGVKRWTSQMSPGSHHLILFFTASQEHPDGTVTENCGVTNSGLNPPIWTYSAQTPENEFTLPAGVGMKVRANQKAFVQLHYLNTTDAPLVVQARINGYTYAAGESYTPASAYITFHNDIEVMPNSTGSVEGQCDVPSTAKFFTLSTHAHRFATKTQVLDGTTTIFESDDWEHPGTRDWPDPPHYSFTDKLRYRCEYYNFTDQTVRTGDSAKTDEMCMAVGYFFPAEKPIFCIGSFLVPF